MACGRTGFFDAPEGVDAGLVGDGGKAEAGLPDAGRPDGGRPDAGAPDAAPRDAGPRDTGCILPGPDTIAATLRMTVDDEYRVWVNGVLIDDVARVWTFPQTYIVELRTDPRAVNVLAIEGRNRFNADGFDRGGVVDLSWFTTTSRFGLVSDADWKTNPLPPAGWEQPGFDDSSWPSAVAFQQHGGAPWFSVLGNSAASWIWSSVPAGLAPTKPTDELVALRRTFSLDAVGAPVSPAKQCLP